MKAMLVALGLFVLGFGGIAAFSGLPTAPFGASDSTASADNIAPLQLVTLADYSKAAEKAYERMLIVCTVEDRKAYGRAMNALAVAKRHADTGKIERGNIGDGASRMMGQFVAAVRKGVITRDHVPFGSLRSVITSVRRQSGANEPQPEQMALTLRGSLGAAEAAPHNQCQVL